MSLSDVSIKKPVFAWTLMFALIFFGSLSFTKMGINENPDVEYPTLTIRFSYDGATPAVIEKDIVEPVESVLVSMEGIRDMTSTSDRGSARINLEFDLSKDIDFALQEVNSLISRAQRLLPDNIDPPVVTKSNADDRPIMYMALASNELSMREIMVLFRDKIQDRLSTVDGVAEVRPFGYHEPVLRVDVDREKLKNYDLTVLDVLTAIKEAHKELPAGKFEFKEEEKLVRIMGEIEEGLDFAQIPITRRGGKPVYKSIKVGDVANVYEGTENLRRISRINGVPALGMAIQKRRGVNAVATADRIYERVDLINSSLPKDTKLHINFDRTQFIRDSVKELVFTLILSAILTSLVCWLFIGSFSASINILLAIPTAIIGTFIFINWLGFTLNTFSLLGLALAIGIVVDDAVIMLENIIRYMQKGFTRINSAFKGAREITFAVLATSVALIAVFIPITFLEGIEGRFFYEFAVTISVAIALSSLEALTLAPMRCSQFLMLSERKTILGKNFEKSIDGLKNAYKNLLLKCLDNKIKVILGSLLVFMSSMYAMKDIRTEMVPPQDRGALFLIFRAPDGKSLQYTEKKIEQFEKIALAQAGVKRIYTAVGGFGRGGQGNKGNGVVILEDRKLRKLNQFEIAAQLRESAKKDVKGIRIFIRDRFGSSLGGRRGNPVEFTIKGPDSEVRKKIFKQFKEKMDAYPQIVGARSDDITDLPEVHIVPDRKKALKRGVSVDDIASVINANFGGIVASQYTVGGRRFDVFLQLEEQDRRQKRDLNGVLIRNNRGRTVNIKDVVKAVEEKGPQVIFRENRERGLRVDSSLAKGASSGEVIKQINQWKGEIKIPKGYSIQFESTPAGKIFEVALIMLLGLLVAYMALSIQFNSFSNPLIVYLAVPFGLVGSLAALILGGQTLNIFSAIGILLTMGIVKKNSILLVEFTNQLRDKGVSIRDALLESAETRLRPILMTNLATLTAALPPALALGPGAETRVPMALTVIGGVVVSLIFTLFIVPCVYSISKPKRIHIVESE